jgi:hypothetical protein
MYHVVGSWHGSLVRTTFRIFRLAVNELPIGMSVPAYAPLSDKQWANERPTRGQERLELTLVVVKAVPWKALDGLLPFSLRSNAITKSGAREFLWQSRFAGARDLFGECRVPTRSEEALDVSVILFHFLPISQRKPWSRHFIRGI